MVGNTLTRYSDEVFMAWDMETNGLNLRYALPWDLSYALFTLKGGIQSIHSTLIRWSDLRMTPDNPSFAHFDGARYDRDAKDPREVYATFGPLLRKHRSVFHSGVGFDSLIEGSWRRAMGMEPDYGWLYSPGCLDTNCLSKAYRAGWTPDISSPDAFLAWQYAAYHTRLAKVGKSAPKTKLGVMCGEFGIEYDAGRAHGAEYDVRCNVELMRALAWKVEC